MKDFTTELSVLTSAEFTQGKNDPARISTMFERLIASAGFTIAMMAEGDAVKMQELLAGAESYLYESAAEYAAMAKMLARTMK